MGTDQKRGSKFTLPDKATLLQFKAYLNGTGATGDGAANWYSNIDTFADGSANPFGTGWSGSVTLSVYATYTMGY